MSFFVKILGTIANRFGFDGGDGPQLVNNAGTVEVRNSADTALTSLRAVTVACSRLSATTTVSADEALLSVGLRIDDGVVLRIGNGGVVKVL